MNKIRITPTPSNTATITQSNTPSSTECPILTPTPTECLCYSYDITITQQDLDDATGNTVPGRDNNTVFVQWQPCDESITQEKKYTVAGTYEDQICVSRNYLFSVEIFYWKNDASVYSGTSSSSQQNCCIDPTATPTITPTMTMTPSSTPLCPDTFTLTQTGGSGVNILQGQFNRITTYTGGTYSYGFFSGSPIQFITGTAPNGNNYPVYERQVGGFWTDIAYNYAAVGTPPNVNVWRAITTTGSSIVNGASFAQISGSVAIASASTIYNGVYIPPFISSLGGRSWTFDYPALCPTSTPTTTPSSTPLPCICYETILASGGQIEYVDCSGNTITTDPLFDYFTFNAISGTPQPIGSVAFQECVVITPTMTSTPSITPTNTPTNTQTSTPTSTIGLTPTMTSSQTTTPTNTPTNTGTPTSTPTSTPPVVSPTNTPTTTQTPSPTNSCPNTIYTHGAVRATCSDFCNENYLIQTVDCASETYAGLTIGDFIYGYAGQSGYIAYSNVSTDTNTGPFRIADIDGSGEILGIYVCSGGSCIPL